MSDGVSAPSATTKPTRRRRLLRLLVIVAVVAIVLRIALSLALPSIVAKVAKGYGLTCTWDRLDLTLLGLNAELWHLEVGPIQGGEPFLHAAYCRVDVSLTSLLAGRLVVRRVDLDAVDIRAERDASGEWLIARQIRDAAGGDAPRPAEPTATAKRAGSAEPVDFSPGIEIDGVALHDLRAHVVDRSASPAFEAELHLEASLFDLGSTTRPTRLNVVVSSPSILESLSIRGHGTGAGRDLDARLEVAVTGFQPRPLEGILGPLGVRPIATNVSFALRARAEATPARDDPDAIRGSVVVEGLVARADGEEAIALDRASLEADGIGPLGARLSSLDVTGVRANVARSTEGLIRVLGLELLGSGSSAPEPSKEEPSSDRPWSLAKLAVRDVRVGFHDDAVSPAASIALSLPELTIANIVADPSHAGAPATIAARIEAPGCFEALAVRGTAMPFAARRTLDLEVNATGIRPVALKPYLDAAHVESVIENGSFECRLRADAATGADGRLEASAAITGLRLSDGRDLLALDEVRVDGVAAAAGSVRVDRIAITGPRLEATKEASGVVEAVGLRLLPAPGTPVAVASPSVAAPSRRSAPPPRISVGRFEWKGVHAEFHDAAVTPETTIVLADAEIEATGLVVDPNPNAPATQPGKIRAWLAVPNVAERITLEGSLALSGGTTSLALDVAGTGVTASALAPYLAASSIAPDLENGSLRARLVATATVLAEGMKTSASLEGVSLKRGDEEMLGCDAARVEWLTSRSGDVDVEVIEVVHPRTRVRRDADGSIRVAGQRLLLPPPPRDVEPPTPIEAAAANAASTVASIRRAQVSAAEIDWIDAALEPPLATALHLDATIEGLSTAPDAGPARLSVLATVEGCTNRLAVTGTVSASPTAHGASLHLEAAGLRAGPLARYLIGNAKPVLEDGHFRASIDAQIESSETGGRSARLVVHDVDYREGESGEPLLRLADLRVLVSRLDPDGGILAIDELSASGFAARIERTEGGTRALGFEFERSPEAELVGVAAPTPVRDAIRARIARRLREEPPHIMLRKLDVGLEQVTFTDASRRGGAPIVLSKLRLWNEKPLDLFGDAGELKPAVELRLEGRLDPLIESFGFCAKIAPAAAEPWISVDLFARGIAGANLDETLPELRERLDASALQGARFGAHLMASIKGVRGGLLGSNFADGFGLDAALSDVTLQDGGGQLLARIGEVHVDVSRIDTVNGNMRVHRVDIVDLVGGASRVEKGVAVAGVTFVRAPESPPSAPDPPAAADPDSNSGPEIRIDRFSVSGLDFTYRDEMTRPPTLVPLVELDFDVRNVTSRAVAESIPMRFDVHVGSGRVPLTKPRNLGLIRGALSDTLSVVGLDSSAGTAQRQDRELFEEISACGELTRVPRLTGWVEARVGGLELQGLQGVAARSGVRLDSGVLDSRVDLRFKGDGSLGVDSAFAFTDLSLSESASGPITRYLRLPAPLDTVVFALRDQKGVVRVPLVFNVSPGSVSATRITELAITTLGRLIVDAIANSPFRIFSGMTDLVPSGLFDWLPFVGGAAAEPQLEPVVVSFVAGASQPSPAEIAKIAPLLERLRDDETLRVTLMHTLGGGDVACEATRASPSVDDCRDLTLEVRSRLRTLAAEREALADDLRARFAAGLHREANDLVTQIRAVDEREGRAERALDRLGELLRPGAGHGAPLRTQKACRALGRDRLGVIERALHASGIVNLGGRIRVLRPLFTDAPGLEGGTVTLTLTAPRAP